jgi:hypothetical protein
MKMLKDVNNRDLGEVYSFFIEHYSIESIPVEPQERGYS